MAEVLYYAIPFFVLLLVAEYASFRHLDHDDDDLVGYDLKDTGTSLSMGIGNVVINVGWKLVVVAIYAALYELTPLRLDPHNPLTWIALFFADDLAYYWFHRVSHESRVFWASHVVHHSSQHFNLSTALRQTWVPMTYFPFWLPLPLLGFPVWMVLLAQAWSLIYQFWIHTERIKRLPKPARGRLQHAVPPPRPPRDEPPVPGQELRGHPDHLGPHVRHVRARAGARAVRPDDAAHHAPPGEGGLPRVHRARPRHQASARRQDEDARSCLQGPRAGAPTSGP